MAYPATLLHRNLMTYQSLARVFHYRLFVVTTALGCNLYQNALRHVLLNAMMTFFDETCIIECDEHFHAVLIVAKFMN